MGCRDGLWWRDVLYPMLWRRDHVDARRGEWRSLSHVSSLELSATKRKPSRYVWPLCSLLRATPCSFVSFRSRPTVYAKTSTTTCMRHVLVFVSLF